MAVAKLKPPPSDPLRSALAEAIEAAAEAKSALGRHKAAADKTHRSMWAAQRAHATALSGIDKAISEHAETIVAAVADGDADEDTAPASSILTMARLAVDNAAAEAESYQVAYEKLRDTLPNWEGEAHLADAAAVRAANEILKAPIQDLLDRARQAWATLRPLVELLQAAVVTEQTGTAGTWQEIVATSREAESLEPTRAEIWQFLQEYRRGHGGDGPNLFTVARERLLQNPHCDISDLLAPVPQPPPAA